MPNDITKDAIRRALARFGVRLQKADYLPHTYDRRNYPPISTGSRPIIFDVGGNIGQSALWYSKEFPEAHVHTFEPFEAVFQLLKRNTDKNASITPHNIGLSQQPAVIQVPRIQDPYCQVGSISAMNSGDNLESIQVDTIDEFSSRNNVSAIHILKTDTEGHDLAVLAGAERMFSEGRIFSVVSEATIDEGDAEHTQFSDLTAFLTPKGFKLHGFYDLSHLPETGALHYFNALFVKE